MHPHTVSGLESCGNKSLALPQAKRKSEEFSEQSRGGSCDTSRQSDLMDDARYKKQKVPPAAVATCPLASSTTSPVHPA